MIKASTTQIGFYLSKGAKFGGKHMDGTASNLLLVVQGCALYEISLFLLAKGIFPPQKAPGTDSLQHTVHLLLRHKNTSNVKNMKLAWSFPISVPSAPPSIAFHPEVLSASGFTVSLLRMDGSSLSPSLLPPPTEKQTLSIPWTPVPPTRAPDLCVPSVPAPFLHVSSQLCSPQVTSLLSPRLCSAGTAPHMLPTLLALMVVLSPGTHL